MTPPVETVAGVKSHLAATAITVEMRCLLPCRTDSGQHHLPAPADLGYAMTFGDELGRLLAERGMSQRELARRSHYDSGYINKLVRGVKQATPEVAERLDEVLASMIQGSGVPGY